MEGSLSSRKWSSVRSIEAVEQPIKRRTTTHKIAEKGFTEERKGTSRSSSLTVTSKKGPSDFGRRRGRMIDPSNRKLAFELIQEANRNGARLAEACEELHI